MHRLLSKAYDRINALPPEGTDIESRNENRKNCYKAAFNLCQNAIWQKSVNRTEIIRDDKGNVKYSPYLPDGNLPHNQPVMPEVLLDMLNVYGKTDEILILLDSGAFFNIMSAETVRKLGLRTYTRDEHGEKLRLPCLLFADNRSENVLGCVDVLVNFTKDIQMCVTFFVLKACPYPAFIGSHFMTEQKGSIDYKTGTISIEVGSETANIPFEATCMMKSQIVSVMATKEIVIPPRTANVEVPVEWGRIPESLDGQWGILQDAQCHAAIFKAGLTNTKSANDTSYCCSVIASNPSDVEIRITTNKPVCGFHPVNMDDYMVMDAKFFEDDDEELSLAGFVGSTELDLETEWAKYPHIHKIQIADLDENDEEQTRLMAQLRWMLIRNQEIWNPAPKEVSKNLEEYVIPLETTPVPGRTQPFNPKIRAQMTELLEKQMTKKIIEPSSSPFSSPVVLVPKKDGRMRFVVDYRNINKCITTDRYTTPRVEVALSVLHGNKYYSALDLVDAFWSIPLEKKSRNITAFQTPDGLFHYRFLPQGLKTASAVFCRYMDRMIGNLKWTEVLTYVDDILVFSKNFEDHLNSLDKVCKALSKFNMTLAPHKCFLFQDQVRYLGHIAGRDGVKCDPDKIKAVKEMDLPQNRDTLNSTICKFRYYRRFVMNYAKSRGAIAEKGLSWKQMDLRPQRKSCLQ